MKRQPFLAMVCSMVLSAGIFPRVAHSEDEKSLSFGVGPSGRGRLHRRRLRAGFH